MKSNTNIDNSFKRAIINSFASFYNENYFYRASALTFTTLLAIVPLFAVIVFFISFFPIFNDLIFLTQNYLLENFIPATSINIKDYYTTFIQQATSMPLVNILFLLVTAILLVNTVEETLNSLWKAKKSRKKLFALMLYTLAILLTPLIIGFSIFISSSFFNTEWVTKISQILSLKILIDFLVPVITNTILFTLLYTVIPNVKVMWQYGLLGGFLAAVVFNTVRIIFAWYFRQFDSYTLIYGVFSAIPIFMMWLYIAWVIIIWGALFTYHFQNP